MTKSVTPKTEEQLLAERKANLPDSVSESALQRVSTGRVRYALSQLAQSNVEHVQRWLNAIELVDGPKAAMELYLKMIEYSIPKLSRTEVKVEDAAGNQSTNSLTMEELEEAIKNAARLAVKEEKKIVSEQ